MTAQKIAEAVSDFTWNSEPKKERTKSLPRGQSAAAEARRAKHREVEKIDKHGQRKVSSLSLGDFVVQCLLPHLKDSPPDLADPGHENSQPPAPMGDFELLAISLACYLGPRDEIIAKKVPPANLCRELQGLMEDFICAPHSPLTDQEVMKASEIALAYAGKWKRSEEAGSEDSRWWNAVWPGAHIELTNSAKNQAKRAFKLLNLNIRDHNLRTQGLSWQEIEEERDGMAMDLAIEFITGEAISGETDDRIRRPLSDWNPGRGSLYGWLNYHIVGLGQDEIARGLKAGMFVTGRLFSILRSFGELEADKIAFQVCPTCEKKKEYDGSNCCDRIPWIRRVNVLIVPGVYLPKKAFWLCGACKRYVEGAEPRAPGQCPCGSADFSQKATAISIRKRFVDPVEWDDLSESYLGDTPRC